MGRARRNVATGWLAVAGARPNFSKLAPVVAAARRRRRALPWVHTGQHYDAELSESVRAPLGLPPPAESLSIGAGTVTEQTARILDRLPAVLADFRPAVVVVFGDVTSTLAAALAASQARIPVAHVESGLRSFDDDMPEERNRVLVDRLSARLYVTEPVGVENLLREGFSRSRIRLVGNPMIDALRRALRVPEGARGARRDRGHVVRRAAIVTLHRPQNVDDAPRLARWCDALGEVAAFVPVRFPVHPRTRARLRSLGLEGVLHRAGVETSAPLGYAEFVRAMRDAAVVITDSGGVQEEASFLGVPCLTLRTTTERPMTLSHGTNRLVGDDPKGLARAVRRALLHPPRARGFRRLWDGHAADRIVDDLVHLTRSITK